MENRRTIVIIEDEATAAAVARDLFGKIAPDYALVHCLDKQDFLERIIGKLLFPDVALILMDVQLGNGMTGIQLAEFLADMERQFKIDPIPVIFVSALRERDYEGVQRISNFAGFKQKPLTADMVRKIARGLQEGTLLGVHREP